MKAEDTATVDKVTLKKIQFHISHMMSPALMDDMRLVSESDISTDSIIRHLSFFLYSNRVNVEERDDVVHTYPATMWEELKRDFWPQWLKRRFPVRYSRDITHHTTVHNHVCPHLNYKDNRKHLDFMVLKEWGIDA